ncbi:MAG TPA: hypothetical protein PKE46_01490 [Micropruina sp.]|nr:hypothetical protein [Micropruina sp.]HMR20785.1 hypothetical protein [Micropruina sp.]
MNETDGGRGLGNAARALVSVAAVAVVVTIALAVIGAVRGPVLPAPTVAAQTPGPASTVPSAPVQRVSVDPLSRRLSVEPYLSGQLPGKPFAFDRPTYTKGLFTEATIGGVTSDPDWKPDENLPVAVIVADLEPKTVVAGDLDATGRGVLAELGRRFYKGLSGLAVRDVRSDPPTTIGTYPAQWARATVTGTLSTGAAEKAELSLLVVALPNGRHFVYIEIRPDRPQSWEHFPALDRAAASIAAHP